MLAAADWPNCFNDGATVCALGALVAITVMVVGPTLIYFWYRIAKTRAEAELKQSMIDGHVGGEH